MINTEREVDRYLALLRNKMRQRGFTQLEVQEVLGWGRSYISQLMTKQKSLRLDQVLMILKVINVQPGDFFTELYARSVQRQSQRWQTSNQSLDPDLEITGQHFRRLEALLKGVANALLRKGVITDSGLSAAVKNAERDLE